MATIRSAAFTALGLSLVLAFALPARAQTAVAAVKPAKKAAAATATFAPPVASAEQVEAAGRVYYGAYECDSSQVIHIQADAKHAGYVDVKHLKADYLMKPVVSSTGAIRLEDVRGETLLVQIANKSMLLNVKTGRRVVDDCVSPEQRELVAAAKIARQAQGDSSSGSMFAPTATAAK
jgi:hypothetical protein